MCVVNFSDFNNSCARAMALPKLMRAFTLLAGLNGRGFQTKVAQVTPKK